MRPHMLRASLAVAAGIAAFSTASLLRAQAPATETPKAPAQTSANAPKLSEAQIGANEEIIATLTVQHGKEPMGAIEIRLHHQYAPQHVRNFIKLAESGFYDGTAFHRAGPESFLQGGDPLSRDDDPSNDGSGGPGWELIPELNAKLHERGAVGAANMGNRDSGSQFFIDLKDHPEWDGKYTVFGSVISGLEIADKIAASPRKGEHPIDAYTITVKVEKRERKVKLY